MKELLSLTRRCIDDYNMIPAGSSVAVGVSGGKDSLALLALLARLRNFLPGGFNLTALTLDMGFGNMDFAPIADFCREMDVPFIMKKTQMKEIIFDIRKETNPCSLCAKMRRGALNDLAVEQGCSIVALGHHFDDAVETFLLSLFYEGRINCFAPDTYLSRSDLHCIRPMLFIEEREIINFANRASLPIVQSTCPADKHTKREDIKQLLKTLEQTMPGVRTRIFGAMKRYPIHGWERE